MPRGLRLGAVLVAVLAATPAGASHVASDDSLRGLVFLPAVAPASSGPLVRVEIRRPDGAPAAGLRV